MKPAAAAIALAVGLATPSAAAPAAWADYAAQLAKTCPTRHVEWVCDSCYDEVIAGFGRSLPDELNSRIDRVARPAVDRLCAAPQIGLGCEMAAYLAAYRQLHLLRRFVAFGCRTIRCEEAALCSRMPTPAPGTPG